MKVISLVLLIICFNLVVFSQITDDKNKRFETANADAKEIDYDESVDLKTVIDKTTVLNVSMSDCKKTKKINSGTWVTLATEFNEFYLNNAVEFKDNESARIRELLGLLKDDEPKCITEIAVNPNDLERKTIYKTTVNEVRVNLCPTKLFTVEMKENWQKWQSNNYPFTNLGYTCDWHFNDGCHYGLSEFVLVNEIKQQDNFSSYEIKTYLEKLSKNKLNLP